jgi:hypothetical protein
MRQTSPKSRKLFSPVLVTPPGQRVCYRQSSCVKSSPSQNKAHPYVFDTIQHHGAHPGDLQVPERDAEVPRVR